jgi:hypothetical protein
LSLNAKPFCEPVNTSSRLGANIFERIKLPLEFLDWQKQENLIFGAVYRQFDASVTIPEANRRQREKLTSPPRPRFNV